MVGYCLMCKSKTDRRLELMFHSFPKDETLRQKWIEQMGIKREVSKTSTLCSIHFSQDCFKPAMVSGKPLLKKGSIPTILNLEEFIRRETIDELSDAPEVLPVNSKHETQDSDNGNITPQVSQFQNVIIKEEIDVISNEASSSEYENLQFSPKEIIRDDETNKKMAEELQYSCRKISAKGVNVERFCRLPEALKAMYWMEAQQVIQQQAMEIKKLRQKNSRYKKKVENLTIFTSRMKYEIRKRILKAKIEEQ